MQSQKITPNLLSDMKTFTINNIDKILDTLNIEYRHNNEKGIITGTCPIHCNSDNPNALYFVKKSGIWKCFTHHCEYIFGASCLGLIKGILSAQKLGWQAKGDKTCNFYDVANFLKNVNGEKNIEYGQKTVINKEKQNFSKLINTNIHHSGKLLNLTRKQTRNLLKIPSEYYLNRGFLPNTLDHFDIGDCTAINKDMSNRAITPIYNEDYTYVIGCAGRSIFQKCLLCEKYHNPYKPCPTNHLYMYCKWFTNYGFNKSNILYNYWFAKNTIKQTGKIIIVESPGNTWRLHEAGINNVVAILGSNISAAQKNIIHKSGAMHITLLLDNDDAGHAAKELIQKQLGRLYTISTPSIHTNDIADMTIKEVKQCLASLIKN